MRSTDVSSRKLQRLDAFLIVGIRWTYGKHNSALKHIVLEGKHIPHEKVLPYILKFEGLQTKLSNGNKPISEK